MSTATTNCVRSMTGQGHSSAQSDLGTMTVEVRTVNNRGFKCSPRLSDSLASLESKIESLARSLISRGSVHLNVNWRRPVELSLPNIDTAALKAYVDQLESVRKTSGVDAMIDLSALINLPGVIASSKENRRDDDQLWDFVASTVTAAIDNLNQMRAVEGGRMADSLHGDCSHIQSSLHRIAEIAPRTIDTYQQRLESKIQRALEKHDLSVDTIDLLREVQIYADRSDISEEITRLGSHLQMFVEVLDKSIDAAGQREPTGRKLDFVIQEMFRETNTIGSKAADSEISTHVVEIKCAIERMRELVQNLE